MIKDNLKGSNTMKTDILSFNSPSSNYFNNKKKAGIKPAAHLKRMILNL